VCSLITACVFVLIMHHTLARNIQILVNLKFFRFSEKRGIQ